jgi:glycogen debranching enzyme
MSTTTEIRVQALEEGNFHDGKLYKLQQSWILRLTPNPRIAHKHIRLFCNITPPASNLPFKRTNFYEYPWQLKQPTNNHDDFDRHVDIACHSAGSYHYFFTYGEDASDFEAKRGGCTFLIDPILTRPVANSTSLQVLELNGLQVQTVLSKLLGPLDQWRARLECAKHSGYNVLHFTPIQELSTESNSSYSIRDHLKLLATASDRGRHDINALGKVMEDMRSEWGVLSICDLVYNHMAVDSELLVRAPHAAYNLVNSPHLIPAFVLDRVFYHFTKDIALGMNIYHLFFLI